MRSGRDIERSQALAGLYTGAVADILDELGYREQCLPADIRPLREDMKVAAVPMTTARTRATRRWTCWTAFSRGRSW